MDARTCHFHRTVGYGANGCRKIRIASRMMMMMMRRRRMMTMMLMMRHCEGAAAWRDAQCMWREFTWGGGAWSWTFRAERRYLDPKREHPTMSIIAHHLVHLNSHLEVYIGRHTRRAGKKTRSVLAQTPLGTWKMDVEKSECQVEWWWWWGGGWWWWCWWWWWWWWRDTAKGLLQGGVPFSWSFKDKGSSPPLCFAK